MLACETFPLLAGGKSLVAIGYTVATTSLVVQNLRSFLVGQGLWNGNDAIDLTFTIPIGTSVWSNNKAYAAIEVLGADFPVDSVIRIVNAGLICGKGDWSPAGGAIKATRPIVVDNPGEISGGGKNVGGSGGSQGQVYVCSGSGCEDWYCGNTCYGATGGTGYGYGYSSAGSARTTGATGSPCGGSGCPVGAGGSGGTGGLAGDNGYSVSGNANITWLNTGTRNGSIT